MLCRISLEITHEFTPRINLKNFWPSQWSTPGILIRLSLICVSQPGFRERKAKSGLQSKTTDRTSSNFGALDMVLARKRLTRCSLCSAWRDGVFSVETLERIRPTALFLTPAGHSGRTRDINGVSNFQISKYLMKSQNFTTEPVLSTASPATD